MNCEKLYCTISGAANGGGGQRGPGLPPKP